jgi:hypothetical protein
MRSRRRRGEGRGVEKTRPGTKTLHDVPDIIMHFMFKLVKLVK